MKKILVVEDAAESYDLIQRCLVGSHWLKQARGIRAAETALASDHFDLIILDLNLPDGDGLHFCSILRANDIYEKIPVIVMSGRNTTSDKVMAFMVGADDYMTKPFSFDELRARVDAKLRRRAMAAEVEKRIQIGAIEIDQASQRVTMKTETGDEDIDLTALELKILLYLSKQKDRVLSRNEILDAVWGQNVHVFARNVDTHVSKLRRKLGRLSSYIQSAHGKGYCFASPESLRFLPSPVELSRNNSGQAAPS